MNFLPNIVGSFADLASRKRARIFGADGLLRGRIESRR